MRVLQFLCIGLALGSAVFLYGLTYDTQRLQQHVRHKERSADRARGDIAVLRAERAHLARPERIAPLARAQGLEPPQPEQFLPAATAFTPSAGSPAQPR